MSYVPSGLAASAIAFSFMATTASADLSPAEVWGDWRAYLEGMGYSVTATEERAGDTLIVSGITAQKNLASGQPTVTYSMGSLQFVQQAGGTVEIVIPTSWPITVERSGTLTDRPVQMEIIYTHSGQNLLASGDADAMVFDYTADTVGLSLENLTVDGTTYNTDHARLSVRGEALQSRTEVTVGDTRSYDQTLQTSSLSYDLFFKDPAQIEALQISSTLQNINYEGSVELPDGDVAQTEALSALFAEGLAIDGTLTTGGTETQTEVTSADGTSKIKTGTQDTTLAVVMGQDGVRYDMQVQQVQIGAQLAGLPFPLFAEMARSGMSLSSPVQKSDTPQDFALSFDMTDFTMSDIIWAMFDPSNQLPRDPATIAVDLTGKAKLLINMLDRTSVEAFAASGATPSELEALTINRLEVDALGAKINAQGDLAFDNTDKGTLPGFPKPVGEIDINIAGANGLMDKLAAMGLLPPQQLTGARLMLGLFAVPGTTPDTLSSKIEFNEAGQIRANGQRIK